MADASKRKNQVTAEEIASAGDDEQALKILTSGRDVDLDSLSEVEGASILYIASSNGWKKSCAHLLELPTINVHLGLRDSKDTPLHVSVERGHAQIVQSIVRKGADVNKPDDNDQTALHTAVFHSHLKTVKYLLKKGAKLDAADKDGAMPLHLAAYVGHVDIIATLLEESKQDPNATDLDGCTPLSFAVDQGFAPAVTLLLEHGADYRSDLNGETPIHKAVASNKPEVLQILIDKHPKDKIRALIDETNLQGLTPLMMAATEGFDECARLLLAAGAAPSLPDAEKSTPLHMSSLHGHTKIVEYLTEKNADLLARDIDGNTPFHKAAEGGTQSVLAVLARKSVEPNTLSTTNKQGTTPLMMACGGGHIECVRILLMFSDPENISKVDKLGYNALHLSAAGGKEEIVRALLSHPNAIFDVDQLTSDKFAPITLALKGKHFETARTLAAFGALFVLNSDIKRMLRHIQEDKLKEIEAISKSAVAEGIKNRRATITERDFARHSMRKRRITDRSKGDVTQVDFSPPTAVASAPASPIVLDLLTKSPSTSVLSPEKKRTKTRKQAPRNMSTNTAPVRRSTKRQSTTKDRRSTSTSATTAPVPTDSTFAVAATKSTGDMSSLVDDLLSDLTIDSSDSDSASSVKSAPADSISLEHKSPRIVETRSPQAKSPEPKVKSPEKLFPKDGLTRKLSSKTVISRAGAQPDHSALLKEAVAVFATKPQKAIDMLIDGGVIEDNCSMVAQFLYENDVFNKTGLGDWLSDRHEFNISVLEVFVEKFDWAGLEFDVALRRFLQKFRLPGEAQKIDRLMEAFAGRYFKQNPKSEQVVFANQDAVYVLAFSTIMLNTDLHNPSIKAQNKMTKPQFVKNNTKINGGENFPDKFVEDLYDRIKENEIKMDAEDNSFSDAEIKGWLTKQGGRIKTWKKRWFALKENCLFYFKTEKDKEPAGIIPLEDLVVSMNRKLKYCFELTKPASSGLIKATARKGEGLVMAAHESYIFQAESAQLCQKWVDCINRNIFKNPIHQLMAAKRQQAPV